MLVLPPVVYRPRRGRVKAAAVVRPPARPLVLAGASYHDDDPLTLTLVFDRPIDVSGLVGAVIVVNDGESYYLTLAATGGAEMVDAVTVRLSLESLGGTEEPGILLDAGPGNGIVAVDDGGKWAGVVDLGLPFP